MIGIMQIMSKNKEQRMPATNSEVFNASASNSGIASTKMVLKVIPKKRGWVVVF